MRLLAAVAVWGCLTGVASAQTAACSAPTAPQPLNLGAGQPAPELPKCINRDRGTHTCRNSEVSRYNKAMEAHNAAQETQISAYNAYNEQLQAYFKAASAYANCEAERVRREMTPRLGG